MVATPRRRLAAILAVVIIADLIAVLLAPTAHAALLSSVMITIALGGLAATATPGLRDAHPVVWRASLCAALVAATLWLTFFLPATTNFNLATGASMSIVLLGLSFLTGASGQISLGNGAFMGVGAFAVAIWANHHSSTPIVITLLIATACGAIVGLLLGLPATRLRGPYLAGMTLAFAVAFTAILGTFNSWTGGDSGLQLPVAVTPPRWIVDLFHSGTQILTTNSMWLADISILVAGVAFFVMANLFASRTGRAMRLIRDNDVAAELVGIPLPRMRVLAFTISSAYAALGGGVYALINNAVSPSTFTFPLSVTILSLIVIGGIGTIPGALIGGIVYAYSANVISWITNNSGLNPQGNLASQLNGIIFGALLIVTMLFAPLGISGSVHRMWRARREHRQG